MSLSCRMHLLFEHGVSLPRSCALGSWCLSLARVVIVGLLSLVFVPFVVSVWIHSSLGFLSFALTRRLVKFALDLYAILGVVLRNLFSMGISVLIEVQCLRIILKAFLALGQYLVTNVGLLTRCVSGFCLSVVLVFVVWFVLCCLVFRPLEVLM